MTAILVVDDEPGVREVAVALFESFGRHVVAAANAAEALLLLEAHPEIVMLFTDVTMPGMSGVELAAEARRRWPGLKTVLTSGYAGAADPHDAPVVRKPWRAGDIAALLEGLPQGHGRARPDRFEVGARGRGEAQLRKGRP